MREKITIGMDNWTLNPKKVNPKELPVGSVGYYVRKHRNKYDVHFGIVLEHYAHEIALQHIVPPNNMLVDGVPIAEFPEVTEWRKLPKGWSWDTRLFEISYAERPSRPVVDLRDPNQILKAYADGDLVDAQYNSHPVVEAEIDHRLGYRLYKNYEKSTIIAPTIALDWRQVFTSYDEANARCIAYQDRLNRLADMDDDEWSLSLIEDDIYRWVNMNPGKDVAEALEWILSRGDVETIETRLMDGKLEWKREKNRRWMEVPV